MNRLKVSYSEDFVIDDFHNEIWQKSEEIKLRKYWSGNLAENTRHAEARLVWTEKALVVRFEGNQQESLIVNSKPNRIKKTMGLWERDVFEVFVTPDFENPRSYFEFEVAPTGEWLDAKIEILPNGTRTTDFHFNSGMTSAVKVLEDKIFAVIKIDWIAFGKKPQAGESWRGNLFRCVGKGADRGYLVWQPTKTLVPNFHIPEAFGKFEFVKN
ncbi:MAG: carbohydrate-binding family 9-like protein [Acidobacteriota bacterium]|nr:carbohydrate-binding family 9-like protein [Acidobacteriota bacterium]